MPSRRQEIQTGMARHEPLRIDYGDYTIHVISDPHTLPFSQQNRLIKEIRRLTRKYRPQASRKEVQYRTVDSGVSILLLVREKKGGNAVGYFSTRTPLEDTIHLHASVFDPKHQNLGVYGYCKLLAQALERQKMLLHGQTPRFLTTQSQEPHVLTKMAQHDGMLPAPLHPGNPSGLKMQARRVSEALDSKVQYDDDSGIRIAGLAALSGRKGGKPLDPHEIEKALRRMDGLSRMQMREVLGAIEGARGDAVLLIRPIDSDQHDRIDTLEQTIHPHLQPLLLAELALGRHRQRVGSIQIHSSITLHPTGQKVKLLEINVDPQRLDVNSLMADLEKEREEQTPMGMALQGTSDSQEWERTAQAHRAITPAGPKMLIPLGPMVRPFLQLLARNIRNRPGVKET